MDAQRTAQQLFRNAVNHLMQRYRLPIADVFLQMCFCGCVLADVLSLETQAEARPKDRNISVLPPLIIPGHLPLSLLNCLQIHAAIAFSRIGPVFPREVKHISSHIYVAHIRAYGKFGNQGLLPVENVQGGVVRHIEIG